MRVFFRYRLILVALTVIVLFSANSLNSLKEVFLEISTKHQVGKYSSEHTSFLHYSASHEGKSSDGNKYILPPFENEVEEESNNRNEKESINIFSGSLFLKDLNPFSSCFCFLHFIENKEISQSQFSIKKYILIQIFRI